MADELTISEAVQRYEVSRKTVRRRLAEGAIDGARQRPGDHGPEWIFPSASLEALGYQPRVDADADGSTRVAPTASAFERSSDEDRRRRAPAGVLVALALIIGPLLGFFFATLLGGSDSEDPAAITAVLDELTRPGDRIGVVTPLDTALPEGRVAVPVEGDVAEVADEVRYVVVSDDAPVDVVESLQASSRLVLALENSAEPRWVFDTEREPVPASTVAPPSTDDVDPPTTEPPSTEPPSTEPPTTAPPTTVDPGPPVEGDTDADPDDPEPGVTVRGTVTVEQGDHFWSIAQDIVAESLGEAPTDAQVTAYWAQLIDANVDQLVEPGNPDLLLPGQVLQLPSV